MRDNKVFEALEYGLKRYSNPRTGGRINLLEYFSLVDEYPLPLAKLASKNGYKSLAVYLRNYSAQASWSFMNLRIDEKLALYHSINGHELTADDKLTVVDKLQSE